MLFTVLWLEALRSGRYKQGTQVLKHNDEFCCLGVLQDLCPIEPSGDRYYLSVETIEWAFERGKGLHNPQAGGKELADLNDSGSTFSEIADLIEANL